GSASPRPTDPLYPRRPVRRAAGTVWNHHSSGAGRMEPTGTKETGTVTGGRQAAPGDAAGTRRAAILAAAGEAFLSKGYAATTTLEIARLARTSKRALYQHFADKRAILDEMVRERSGEMIAPIAAT